jgi:acyl carrier protein
VNQEQVQSDVVKILDDITYDWDLDFGGGIGPGTWLVADLDFGSLDVVELFVAL